MQDPVIGRRIESLDRTGIHLQQSCGRHEGAQGDVHLVAGPTPNLLAAGPLNQVHLDHAPVGGQGPGIEAPGAGHGAQQPISLFCPDLAFGQKHHQVGGIGDLALVP